MTRVLMISPVDPAERAARIVEIQRAAYRIEAELMGFDAIPPLHETEAAVAGLGDLSWFGAFYGQVLAGVIAWECVEGDIEIDRLAVDPSYHRQGHGRRLVAAVVAAVPNGAVATVSTGAANVPALSLYRSLGFTPVGRTEIEPGIFTVQLQRQPDL